MWSEFHWHSMCQSPQTYGSHIHTWRLLRASAASLTGRASLCLRTRISASLTPPSTAQPYPALVTFAHHVFPNLAPYAFPKSVRQLFGVAHERGARQIQVRYVGRPSPHFAHHSNGTGEQEGNDEPRPSVCLPRRNGPDGESYQSLSQYLMLRGVCLGE